MHVKEIKQKGFTLLELLVVIAIIGVLVAVILAALSSAREKGRDGARKAQSQEILKALELYYSDNSRYPTDGGAPYTMSDMIGALTATPYFPRPPEFIDDFRYCAPAGGNSYIIAVNTEQDQGGSEYCHILRGPGPDYGCDYAGVDVDATDSCEERF